MKNKGFTLIELIVSIGLMAFISTIIINVSLGKIKDYKLENREVLINSLELAAKKYALNFSSEITDFDNLNYAFITVEKLISKNLLENSIIDPITDKPIPLSDTIYVTRNENGGIKSYYDINQKENPKLILNGGFIEYIKIGSDYNDPGISAKDKNGNDISSQVVVEGEVNTEKEGSYIIKYKYNEFEITRHVIIY